MTHTPTNAAVVLVTNLEFDELDHSTVIMSIDMKVNGPTPNASGIVQFPYNATRAVKAEAVRTFVNAFIAPYEPDVLPLANAAIQISGLPV